MPDSSQPSTGNNGPTPKAGTKRPRDKTSPSSAPPPSTKRRRARGTMPPSETKARRDQHHLKLADVKPEDEKLKLAFYTHLRMMWGSFHGDVVPELPALDAISAFEKSRYVSPDDLDVFTASLDAAYSNIIGGAISAVDSMRQAAYHSRARSQIAANIYEMDEHFLRVTYSAILSFGLQKWRPDVLGNFGSAYNQVHELIAIKTFQTIAISHAYSRLSPNLVNLANHKLLSRFYRNYVYSYIYKLAKKEMKAAGSVKKGIRDTNTYKRRKETAEERTEFLRSEGYRSRVIALSEEVECHSDDEPSFDANGNPILDAAGNPVYSIYAKSARNPHITEFFRVVDVARAQVKAATKKRRNIAPPRTRVPSNLESDISQRFPVGVPLDWFEPNYFNALPAALRANYTDAGIALPLAEDISLDNNDYKTLKKTPFMKRYGNKVKERYHLPSEEELAQMDKSGDGTSSDEDDMDV
ncbi:hypothetical protein DFH07DRAFT_769685 [Mycena maculata]|uniref:Uncharacterized protein n=1 Tax=Mycena maculata TaxID=230809 RepID=A0AAD7JKV1_9AGAR|nr:hypothetical protein DFH07DRAFT_769685 [Mycena maculata]